MFSSNSKKIRLFFLLISVILCLCGNAQNSDTLIIHFDFDQSVIRGVDSLEMQHFFNRNLSATNIDFVVLSAHCDKRGSYAYNEDLSYKRARVTKDFIERLMPGKVIIKKLSWFGKREQLNNNADENKQALNRRVLIIKQQVKKNTSQQIPGQVVTTIDTATINMMNDSNLVVGRRFILRDLNFIGGRHFLLPSSNNTLENLLNIMKRNPTLKIEIDGYVCCISENLDGRDIDTKSNDLSVLRAKYIFEYLKDHEINQERMLYKGFGGSNKLFPEERNEIQRSLNRRTEIKILFK